MADDSRENLLRMLNDGHEFPGEFMFKVIGANTPEFAASVLQAVVVIVGPEAAPDVSLRESAQGRHQSVTVRIRVDSAHVVLDVYEAFRSIAGVRYVL